DFSNSIELEDFRSFLLFTMNSQVPSNLLAQIGFGNSKEVINLPYNPLAKMHYQKINLITSGSLIVYVKCDPISEDFLLEKENSLFKKFLNPNEFSLAFRGNEKILIPKISDCSSINSSAKINVKIDDLYHSFQSFMAVAQPNIVFVLEGGSDKPDIIFAFNMMPQISEIKSENVLKIDVYIDQKHETKGKTYIKREEDFTIEFLNDIKEYSHADLYKSAFSLILRVKSLKNPL
ncbi:MAG: hypothetical protein ACFFAT_15775, partial [Promethearchaeota archaeon]